MPGVRVRWRGSLRWDGQAPGDDGPRGPDEHLLGACGVARLEPHLRAAPARAVYAGSDGAVDPVAVTDALVRAARVHGARLAVASAATALRVQDGRVVGVDGAEAGDLGGLRPHRFHPQAER